MDTSVYRYKYREYRKIYMLRTAQIFTYTGALLAPVYVFAATEDASTIEGILVQVGNILNLIIPILISLAVIYFLWGVGRYVIAKGPEDKNKARDTMIYGILGMFVIFSIWGIVALLAVSLFGAGTETPAPNPPGIPGL